MHLNHTRRALWPVAILTVAGLLAGCTAAPDPANAPVTDTAGSPSSENAPPDSPAPAAPAPGAAALSAADAEDACAWLADVVEAESLLLGGLKRTESDRVYLDCGLGDVSYGDGVLRMSVRMYPNGESPNARMHCADGAIVWERPNYATELDAHGGEASRDTYIYCVSDTLIYVIPHGILQPESMVVFTEYARSRLHGQAAGSIAELVAQLEATP